MSKLRNTVATLAALALTASLGAAVMATDEVEPEPVGVFQIEGMTWLLTGQAIDGQIVPVPERLNVSLQMQDGQAGGHGGCNSYFTSYEINGFDVSFGPVGSTLMACLPPLMDVEQAYFANLGEVVSYQSGGIQMAFLDANGDFVLEFDLAPEATVVGAWTAQGINNGSGGVVSSATTSAVTAEFSPDGDLTGSDGCDEYFTTYEVDGDAIAISEMIGSTRMACPSDELAEQSQQYFAALVAATTWAVDAGGSLELRDGEGALQVKYLPTE